MPVAILDAYLFPTSTHMTLWWEAACEGKQSGEENSSCVFDCLIRFVGLETNERHTHMPGMWC